MSAFHSIRSILFGFCTQFRFANEQQRVNWRFFTLLPICICAMTIKLDCHLCTHRFRFWSCIGLTCRTSTDHIHVLNCVFCVFCYIRQCSKWDESHARSYILGQTQCRHVQEKRRRREGDKLVAKNESCMCAVMRQPPFIRFRKFREANSWAIYSFFFIIIIILLSFILTWICVNSISTV